MTRLILFGCLLCLSLPALSEMRIVSAGSTITELIIALGVESELVAVDSVSQVNDESRISRLGYHRQLSSEGILSLTPDLLVGSSEAGPPQTIEILQAAGISTLLMPQALDVAGLKDNLLQLANRLQRPQEAERILHEIDQQEAVLNRPISTPKSVIFLLMADERNMQIGGRNTLADSLITTAGGLNPAALQVEGYRPVTLEGVIQMQPDIILIGERRLGSEQNMDSLLQRYPLLRSMPHARQGQILTIDSTSLNGGFGLKTLAEALRLHSLWYSS
ncbi:heme/hemin ABC transporter substrate-binding protein [Nitrincola sp. MINF-07-Sa-05]|uniref:heme/hemin ABC transporter substrate-binding protein n=1 Tax=Nitrincola salilacus TaxID=3400273 RepID=UPI003917FA20